jgi:hypothetical protein
MPHFAKDNQFLDFYAHLLPRSDARVSDNPHP